MPRYTVVMPARDAEQTIASAIRSVLRSFPADTEIVVWDDGSTDRTAQVAGEMDARKVFVRSSPESVGGGAARQKILDSTDSEFVVNQDADDVTLPWRHGVQSRMLDSADLVFSAVIRFSGAGLVHRPSLPLWYGPRDVAVALLLHNPLSHPTLMARRTALEDVGGYSSSNVADDYELWLRATARGARLRRSGIPCLAYRLSQSQVSRQPGYAERVLSDRALLDAYSHLAAQLLPASGIYAADGSSSGCPPSVALKELVTLVDSMSPHLRPYYRHLMRSGRYGHLGAHAIEQRQTFDE